jgi:RimJ/RimL family protein N-acetyltransferase
MLTETRAAVIRAATEADIPALVAMGREFRAQTGYHRVIAEDAAQMATFCRQLLGGLGTILVLEDDGGLIGMIGLTCLPHFLSGEVTAGEVFWWVDLAHRGRGLRLLRAAEAWARAQGAVSLQMIAPDARVERLYERLGYVAIERTYQRRLDG